MMNGTLRCLAVAILDSLAACGALTAQNVLVHEVRADAGDRWVELHNRGAVAVDLSQWSLHHATTTPLTPRNYWWPFPAGTTIAPGAFLRVHWLQAAPATIAPGELYTGDSPYQFLFSQGAEPLSAAAGALALMRSQNVALMSSSSIIEDWVSWGQSGFTREGLAVQAGVWSTGAAAAAITPGSSLARNTPAIGTLASRALEWFVDATPTPLAANISGTAVHSHGQACTAPGHHLFGLPTLRTNSLPLLGNSQFGYVIDNTTGVFGELAFVVFAGAAAPANQVSLLPPITNGTCREFVDHTSVLAVTLVPTQVLQTNVALPLGNLGASFAGLQLHAQALVVDWLPNAWPPYQGVSNAVCITLGN